MELNPRINQLVTVFGGSGFVGRHVVRALLKRGYRVRVAVRRTNVAAHILPSNWPGQVMPVQANLRVRPSVERALAGSDAVVNLVGILRETGRQRFDAVHGFGARAVARSAAEAGIGRLVHVSAIGADPASESDYARSKAEGEAAVFEARPEAVVLRPSVIFGPEDHFFNRFAAMARISPVVPLVGAETRFQPVFVGDVAEAVATAVDGVLRPGAIYELGGPEIRTLRQLIECMLTMIRRRRLVLDIPFGVARPLARILEWLPGAPLTADQVRLLARDNVVSDAARQDGRTLEGMGITPRSVEAVLPSYIYRFRRFGQYDVRTPA
jgi:NADH dehydrogenase